MLVVKIFFITFLVFTVKAISLLYNRVPVRYVFEISVVQIHRVLSSLCGCTAISGTILTEFFLVIHNHIFSCTLTRINISTSFGIMVCLSVKP
jgi:hypothetical protein